jgi:hypothetical protein
VVETMVPLVDAAAAGESRYKGVAGWLLFLCVSFTILNPVGTAIILAVGFSQNAPYFARFPGLLVVSIVDVFVSMGVMGLSVFAGISLWQLRPGAVRLAQTFLYVGAVYTVIAPFAPLLAGLPSAATGAILTAAVSSVGRGLLYYAIWLNYLRTSKRVQATYVEAVAPA